MSPELHTMLREWLETGTEAQKMHARNRLAIGDAEAPSGTRPAPSDVARRLAKARECPHFDRKCGCQWATCRLKGRAVGPRECLECPMTDEG